MQSDADIIVEIDEAFGGCAKPDHFGDYLHCEECAEHEQLLRGRTRETLVREDAGQAGWDPFCFSSAAGIAYYFSKLARFTISPPFHHDWYGDQLFFHLSNDGSENRFLQFCNGQQRRAVCILLAHLEVSSARQKDRLPYEEEMSKVRAIWCAL